MERLAARARLPVQYTQGFNPRPVLSLVLPRPVGVAALDDLLAASLTEDIDASQALAALGEASQRGMRFLRARRLEPHERPAARRASFRMPLRAEQARIVAARCERLARQDAWCVQRSTPGRDGRGPGPPATIDLKGLVADLVPEAQELRWDLVAVGDRWARPGEVLTLLGLDGQADLATVERTGVDYGLDSLIRK